MRAVVAVLLFGESSVSVLVLACLSSRGGVLYVRGETASKLTNHRQHPMSEALYNKLFEPCETDHAVLCPMLAVGASKMREKLCVYAKDHLPGGRYWNPDTAIKRVLSELTPSNDLCESILGLNDYLTTAIERRRAVQKDCRDQAVQRCELRKKNMMESHLRREALKLKVQQEKD